MYKAITALCLLLAATISLQAQPKKFKIKGEKCTRVYISDPGEFYSTYEFSDVDIQQMEAEKINHVLIAQIQGTHTELTWSGKIRDFAERMAHPEKLMELVVYEVCTIGTKHVLIAPYKYNKDLPDGWAIQYNIFIVIDEKGLKP